MVGIVIRFQNTRRRADLLAVLVCRYFRSYTEFQLIADGDIINQLGHFTDYRHTESLNGLMLITQKAYIGLVIYY